MKASWKRIFERLEKADYLTTLKFLKAFLGFHPGFAEMEYTPTFDGAKIMCPSGKRTIGQLDRGLLAGQDRGCLNDILRFIQSHLSEVKSETEVYEEILK